MSGTEIESKTSTADDRSNIIERLIFDSPRALFIFGSLSLLIFKVGVSPLPAFYKITIVASNPFRNQLSEPLDFYLMWNWLTPYLGWLTKLNSNQEMLIIHILLSFAFIAVVVVALFIRLPDAQARVAMIIFMILPISGSTLYWISYDGPALLLMALAIFVIKNNVALVVVGVLLGLQDFEPTVVGFSALLLALILARGTNQRLHIKISQPLLIIVGAVAGRLFLTVLFHRWGITGNSGRLSWIVANKADLISQLVHGPYLFVWSILGLGWILVATYRLTNFALTRAFIVPLLFLSLMAIITVDKTRVMALVTFPLLCAFWLKDAEFLSGINKKLAGAFALIWLFVPWIWIIKGGCYPSAFNIFNSF